MYAFTYYSSSVLQDQRQSRNAQFVKEVSAMSETEFYEACSHFVERLQDVHDGKIAVTRADVLKKGTGKAKRKFYMFKFL